MNNVIPNEVLSGLRRLDFSFWTPNLVEEYKEDISSDAYSIQHNMWKQEGIEEERERSRQAMARIKEEKAKAEEALATEKAKAINVAKNMLAEGLTIEQVLRISGLSIEELGNL